MTLRNLIFKINKIKIFLVIYIILYLFRYKEKKNDKNNIELMGAVSLLSSLPLEKLKSAALQFNGGVKASELSQKFRTAKKPVLGYIKRNKFYIDLKAIPPSQEKQLLTTLNSIL